MTVTLGALVVSLLLGNGAALANGILFVGTDHEDFSGTPLPDRLGRFTTNGTTITGAQIINVNYRINGVGSGGTFLFAGDPESNKLRRIDFNGNLLEEIIAGFPNTCCNEDMIFDGTNLYHAHWPDRIDRVNPTTGAVLATFLKPTALTDLSDFEPIGMTFVGDAIWISRWNPRQVGIWDPTTNTFRPIFTTPTNAGGLAYDAANGILWVGLQGGWVRPYDLNGNLLGEGFQPFGAIGNTIDGLEFVPGIVVATNDAYTTNEDVALSISAPGVLENDAGDSLTAELVALAEHGSVTLNANGSFTYVPDPNFNGFDSFLYVAHARNTDSNIATVMITVNAVNDPPLFDPIPDQFVNPPLNVDQPVLITGVSPGPPDEIEQPVTFTATSSNTALISTPTITGDGSRRTLTYQRVSNGTGTVTITVEANDGQPTSNTFSRTFDIIVGTTVKTAVQASLTGFSPNPDSTKPPTVEVTITARPIDFDGNGVIDVPADCYRFFRPRTPGQPYNVIPSNADHVPEAPPWRIPDDTVEICGVAQTFTAVLDLSDWITTSGGHTTEIAYVSIVRDPELSPAGDCPTGATCFDRIWTGTKPIGSLSFTTGDAVADKNNVTLRTVDVTFNTATDTPLPGVVAHVYNRNDRAFQNQIFQGQRVGKNPSGALYADIFESTTGLISTCTTNESGICIATEATTGDYLVIVKFIDREHSLVVYSGLPKGPTDFVNGVATKNFTIIKKLSAGTFQGYEKGSKTVLVKPCTQAICPAP